ncbi:BA75_00257T0 [Komagataella pastoris]|uniref:Palmitoyltransferase PFA4 n=1 Tax=Komagataella pastoris TaxID=4922 RepID=A0A1B2J8R4_PICPA|nr:BA75_00257T0 [Komagataella pastoris]
MAVQLRWPWLGIAIPCFLISFIGYNAHYFIFTNYMTKRNQWWFQFYLTMVWISYYLAIKKSPGTPPPDFQPEPNEWRKWCRKCNNYKPERSHHCKTCKVCVLVMDHHCPWTANCVGYQNMPHFIRFLGWVVFTTSYVLLQICKRFYFFYQNRNLPSYLFNKTEIVFAVILFFMDSLVLVTVSALLFRTLYHITFTGMTTIESWEHERLEDQFYTNRLWRKIAYNYYQFHKKKLPILKSWTNITNEGDERFDFTFNELTGSNCPTSEYQVNDDENLVPDQFTIDDVIFPYDTGYWSNLTNTLGPSYEWVLPWGCPHGTGYSFSKADFYQDDQLAIPWPIDGNHTLKPEQVSKDTATSSSYQPSTHKLDDEPSPRNTDWSNDFGERMDDFGVDTDVE